jgi:hypothetical protein
VWRKKHAGMTDFKRTENRIYAASCLESISNENKFNLTAASLFCNYYALGGHL